MSRFSALPVVTSAIIVHICVSVDHFFLWSHTHTRAARTSLVLLVRARATPQRDNKTTTHDSRNNSIFPAL